MRLSECSDEKMVKIVNINISDKKLKQRLLDMGLVINTKVKIKKKGNPIIIKFRDFELCISKNIAYNIIVDSY